VQIALVPVTAASLEAELTERREQLAETLGVEVGEWPPTGGEWDRAAVEFFRRRIATNSLSPWGPMYVVSGNRLVGSAGFFGPPDENGEVEVGYAICREHRRRGLATAAVGELCVLALTDGAGAVRARTTPDHVGSIAVLERNGFVESGRGTREDGEVELVFRRALG
jgi:ribosomal-protein-alanine N-acetyltransferase